MEEQKGERILKKCSNVGYARIDESNKGAVYPKIALSRGKWGGYAPYFYGSILLRSV